MGYEHRRHDQIINRNIKETLNLSGMQFHCQHAVNARRRDQIGNQLGGNRRTAPRLAVLPRIAEIRDHGSNTTCRPTTQRINRDQQFHQIVIGRETCRLQDENILAAHVLKNFRKHFHVCEPFDTGLGQRAIQRLCDSIGKRTVGVTGDQLHGRLIP